MIALTPLASIADTVLLLARIIAGSAMLYYGWPKVKDLQANAEDFVGMGFKPGIFWGTVVAVVEFFGGLAVLFGIISWIAALAFGFQMLVGTIWKVTSTDKPYTDWSYDLLLLALMLVLLTYGPGAYAISTLI